MEDPLVVRYGDSESLVRFKTAINWKPTPHWMFNLNIKQDAIEFGEPEDIADADFYLYDVDEPSIGIGFMYMF